MNLFTLSFLQLKAKPLQAALNVLLLTLGVGMMVVLLLFYHQLAQQRKQNIADIDLVVGAKGSPLQLILCNIFHLDFPTGNISLAEANKIRSIPSIKKAIPVSLGDSYESFRIVGTDTTYLSTYKAKLSKGKLWTQAMEVVLGSEAAAKSNLKIGDTFASAHGLNDSTEKHEGEHHYNVVGILHQTGTVIDPLIFTSLGSVWKVHDIAETDSSREITALLLTFKGAMGALTVPRLINTQTQLQAASPAIELARLEMLIGNSVAMVQNFAYLILLISGISIFVSLYYSLKDREYELALMRVMGAKRTQLWKLIMCEAGILAFSGAIMGIFVGHLVMALLGTYLQADWHYPFSGKIWLWEEAYLFLAALMLGLLAGFIPAAKVYRKDIAVVLKN